MSAIASESNGFVSPQPVFTQCTPETLHRYYYRTPSFMRGYGRGQVRPASDSTSSEAVKERRRIDIPLEIYLKIISDLSPSEVISPSDFNATMLALALVNKDVFRSMCLPIAFQGLVVSEPPPQHSLHDSTYTFCEALIAGDNEALTLAKHVKELRVEGWYTPSHQLRWAFEGPYARIDIFAALSRVRMPKLESLTLKYVPISRYVLTGVAKLSGLRSLTMMDCELGSDIRPEDMHALHALSLTTFNLKAEIKSQYDGLNEAIDPDSKSLRILRANTPVPSSIFLQCKVPLTVLDLGYPVYDNRLFFAFLEATPTITHLTISGFYSPTRFPIPPELLHLASSSLPHLHHLQCPLPIAPYFSGRPCLKSLGLKGRVDYNNHADRPRTPAPEVLPFTSVTLEQLSIPAPIFFSTSLVEYFPNLRVLHMRELFDFPPIRTFPGHIDRVAPIEDFKKRIEKLANAWPTYPPICELELFPNEGVTGYNNKDDHEQFIRVNYFFWDLQLQHEMIEAHLSGASPSLVRVAFSAFIVWERLSSDDPWRVFIPHIHRQTVVKYLCDRTHRRRFTDYNDCYHRLLTAYLIRPDEDTERVASTA